MRNFKWMTDFWGMFWVRRTIYRQNKELSHLMLWKEVRRYYIAKYLVGILRFQVKCRFCQWKQCCSKKLYIKEKPNTILHWKTFHSFFIIYFIWRKSIVFHTSFSSVHDHQSLLSFLVYFPSALTGSMQICKTLSIHFASTISLTSMIGVGSRWSHGKSKLEPHRKINLAKKILKKKRETYCSKGEV